MKCAGFNIAVACTPPLLYTKGAGASIMYASFDYEDHYMRPSLPSIVIDGLPGSGKTSVLKSLRLQSRFEGASFVSYPQYTQFTYQGQKFDPFNTLYHSSSDVERYAALQHIIEHCEHYYYEILYKERRLKICERSKHSLGPFIRTLVKFLNDPEYATMFLSMKAEEVAFSRKLEEIGLIIYFSISEDLSFKRIGSKTGSWVSLECLKMLKREQLKELTKLQKQNYTVKIIEVDENMSLMDLEKKCFQYIKGFSRYCNVRRALKSTIFAVEYEQCEKRKLLRRYSLPLGDGEQLFKETVARRNGNICSTCYNDFKY